MKKYYSPEAKILELKLADIITISAYDEEAEYDDTAKAPATWFN